ncbi:hypothetical protein QSE00_12455 [Arenibacter sp. M-2]|uniref:hypothetical protein n=1 Tax=Arenibacter sp. M-2 TaxID=3053612 RepID=UPI00257097B2|nr:hypothetical protein [Arenibacter sp. M-2]MDL5512633.1 hypothetical protein [Arenibacter sp. M-2]
MIKQMRFKLGVTFEACFQNEERKTLDDYLSGISRDTLLKTGSHFLGFDTEKSKYSDVVAFMNMFFSQGNRDFAQETYKNLLNYVEEAEYDVADYEIPYVGSSLLFFEYVFDNVSEDVVTEKSNEEMERDIFKAYIHLNQMAFTDRGIAQKEADEKSGIKFTPAQALLMLQFHNYDFINYRTDKVFTCQFLRAVSYFEFLSSIERCESLLKAFYEYYGVENYNDYLRRLLGITYSVLMKDKETHTEIHLEDPSHEDFIDKHMLSSDEVAEELDFVTLRSKPLYKVGDLQYRIISPLFVIEMIYNGLYFRLKLINENLSDDQKVKGLYGLKTYEYSEQYALDTLLKEIFGNRYLQKSGKELDELMNGAPDYYIRNGKRAMLFESKDILISKESKISPDYTVLEEELRLKLFENQKGSPKAVIQLATNIETLLKGEAAYDPQFPFKKGIIRPVLVVHYRMFNTAGTNSIVNDWFRDELTKLEENGLDVSRVQDLIIIDIDTLMFNKEALQSKKLNLWDVLMEYQEDYLRFDLSKAKPKPRSESEGIAMLKSSYKPFSFYLDDKVEKLKLTRTPKELLEKAAPLFPE